jgi:quercetin dioxygenase-like cupin family protein
VAGRIVAVRTLRLYSDCLGPKAALAVPLAATTRVIYVREGDATIRAAGQAATLAANSAWHGVVACEVAAGSSGAALLRWELVPVDAPAGEAPGADSQLALARTVELAGPGGYLMRLDRVDFPPGGIAYLHTHRGPGIRCLLAGELRVEVNGASHTLKPGEAWFEAGPDPVLAHASERAPTSFARVMILPRELKGKSSIRYVRPEDEAQPKTQRYQVFCDEFITP